MIRDKFTIQETLSSGFPHSLDEGQTAQVRQRLVSDRKLLRGVCGLIATHISLMSEQSGYTQSPDEAPRASRERLAYETGELAAGWMDSLSDLINRSDPWPAWPPAITVGIAIEMIDARELGL